MVPFVYISDLQISKSFHVFVVQLNLLISSGDSYVCCKEYRAILPKQCRCFFVDKAKRYVVSEFVHDKHILIIEKLSF